MICFLQIEVIKKWSRNRDVKGQEALVQTQKTHLIEEDQGNMIDLHLQEEADIEDLVPEIEDHVPVPEIEEGKTLVVHNKNGNSKLHLSLNLLLLIQLILVVMFQQFTINTR